MEVTGLPSGTIYPALRRLEALELVTSDWEKDVNARKEGRPRRRYYKLTAAGTTATRRGRSTFPRRRTALPEAEHDVMLPLLAWLLALLVDSSFRARERGRWREEWLGELQQVGRHARSRTTVCSSRAAPRWMPSPCAASSRCATRADSAECGFMTRRFSAMDFKLAARMLVRYPGLSSSASSAWRSAS